MSALELLAQLRERGIALSRDGDRLRVKASEGALTPELQAQVVALKPELLTLLAQPAQAEEHIAGAAGIRRGSGARPASFSQRRFWFLEQVEPGHGVHHLFFALRLDGMLDRAALEHSLRQIVERHESLRTRYESRDGRLYQVPFACALDLPTTELRSSDPAELEAIARGHAQAPFDLAAGPLISARLVALNPARHVLLTSIHHSAADVWSVGVFVQELEAFYRAATSNQRAEMAPLAVQYGDFAVWQHEQQESALSEPDLQYWRRQLASAPVLDLPTDRPRPMAASYRGAREALHLPSELGRGIAALAQRERATPFMVVAAALGCVLHYNSGQEDVVFGSPIAGRTRVELEPLIGSFINSIVLRLQVTPASSFAEILRHTREVALDAYAHQHLPFERLVQELRPERQANRTPLFSVALAMQNVPVAPRAWPGLEASLLDIDRGTVSLDQEWFLWEAADGVRGQVRYSTDLFDGVTIRRLIDQLTRVLSTVTRDADTRVANLPWLDDATRDLVVRQWNDTAQPYPRWSTVHAVVAAVAAANPQAVAVSALDGRLTYLQLNGQANRLARYLASPALKPGALIGVCLPRTSRLPVALLAILKAGGAYLPLDPQYPTARLALMLADTAAPLVLTERALVDRLPASARVVCLDELWPQLAEVDDHEVDRAAGPDDLAYVTYTSGSTGTPKGVAVPHRAVLRLVIGANYVALGPEDRTLHLSPISFDASTFEIWGALLHGGGCVLFPGRLPTARDLAPLIRSEGVTAMWLTAALFNAIVDDDPSALRGVRQVLTGGEALSVPHVRRALAHLPGTTIINGYGPTESTTFACCYRVPPDLAAEASSVPIGSPISNTRVYVLDPALHPVPPRVRGELYIAGDGLAHGYLNQPALTADRFVPDPFSTQPGGRLYRTGDVVVWRQDGAIEFVGRVDDQVKIRGFRIEPGEIEARLRTHPAVRDAAVVVHEPTAGDKRLVAYVVTDAGRAPADLREFIRAAVPEYMIPAAFVPVEQLPLGANGKVDRRALPPPGMTEAPAAAMRSSIDLEQRISAIWSDVLGGHQVSADDNFFDVGGHSLLLVQVQRRLQEVLGRDLSIVDLFERPTIRALVDLLGERPEPEPAVDRPAVGEAPIVRGDVAIIGLSGRFPGAATVDAFWRNLLDGVESITQFSDDALVSAGIERAVLDDPSYVKARGVLADADKFDGDLFGYTPREAELIDPQQRVFLECAWEALESAGYDPARYAGAIGVFAGSGLNTYLLALVRHPEALAAYSGVQVALSSDKDFLSTRASYKLGLRGPSITVQTACSTSLVAVHLACRSVLAGDCAIALAGGVRIAVPQQAGYRYQEGSILSPDGHCRVFDAGAAGTVGGNGAAIVVLKRLEAAVADGDTIYAVIKGSAINNDGSDKVGFTAPGVPGQTDVIRAAHRAAGVEPLTISYLEAHGTGTTLGDPIEIAALTAAFEGAARASCAIGSLKTNVGHLDAAAGAAGLIKAALAVRHGELPPSLHFQTPNPRIAFDESPFVVNSVRRPWLTDGVPRRAGVSAFGLGGTNAHVVLEEPPPAAASGPGRATELLTLSARTPEALDALAAKLARVLDDRPAINLADAAFTLQVGRRAMPHRRVIACSSVDDAGAALAGRAPHRVVDGHVEAKATVAFMFTGQGAQAIDMARGIYDTEPVFRDALDRCAIGLAPHLGKDVRRWLYPREADRAEAGRAMQQTALAQPALFAVEYALAQLWQAWGVVPDAMIGHSIGEYVAATLAGVWTLDAALELVAVRGALMQEMAPGAMLAVNLSEDEITPHLEPDVSVAAVNTATQLVLSGPESSIAEIEKRVTSLGVWHTRLATSHAFHSAMMEPMLHRFRAHVARVTLRAPRVPYVSNVTGDWIEAGQAMDPEAWVEHLRSTVRFSAGLRTLLADPHRVLLEVGPGQTLSALARQTAGPSRVVVPSLGRAREADEAALAFGLGQVWANGVSVDWPGVHSAEARRRIALPTYPFERRRYWIDAPDGASVAAAAADVRAPIANWLYAPSWTSTPSPRASVEPGAHWLVFDDGGGVAASLVSKGRDRGVEVVSVDVGSRFDGITGGRATIDPDHPADLSRLWQALVDNGTRPDRIVHLWSLRGAREAASFEQHQALGLYSLLSLLRATAAGPGAASIDVTIATTGVGDVSGAERLEPAVAPLWAIGTVAPHEYPHVRCRIIDLELDAPPAGASQVFNEMLAPSPEALVAYRHGRRWVRGFRRVEATPDASILRECGAYLITGGLGGVGLEIAERLITTCRASVALLSRTPLPPRGQWDALIAADGSATQALLLKRLLDLERGGGRVISLPVDVSDPEALNQAVAVVRKTFGALHGVVHAAGADKSPVPMATLSAADCDAQFLPRVAGLRALDRALGDSPLDFCLVHSSLGAVLGVVGHCAYTAAHLFMDAYVAARNRTAAVRWTTVDWDNWTTWKSIGRVRSASDLTILPDEGWQVIGRVTALARDLPHLIVSTADLEARAQRWAQPQATHSSAAPGSASHPRPTMATPFVEPRDDRERGLCRLWERLLGISPIGVHDNFFELGGDSVVGIQVVSAAAGQGLRLTTRDVFAHPTVAELAAAARVAIVEAAEQSMVAGAVPLTPVQRWFFARDLARPARFSQARLLELRENVAPPAIERGLADVVMHHDALRLRFSRADDGWRQVIAGVEARASFEVVDLSGMAPEQHADIVEDRANRLYASFDLAAGPLVGAVLFRGADGERSRLLVAAHHLLVDATSWQTIVADLADAVGARSRGQSPRLPRKTTSFKRWSEQLQPAAIGAAIAGQADFWIEQATAPSVRLPRDKDGGNRVASAGTIELRLSPADTDLLVKRLPERGGSAANALLAAVAGSCLEWAGGEALRIDVEGYGRDAIVADVDVSRTVGWFTAIYPLLIAMPRAAAPAEQLRSVETLMRRVPDGGIGYGLLRYLGDTGTASRLEAPAAEVSFLYLGGRDSAPDSSVLLAPAAGGIGDPHDGDEQRSHLIEVTAFGTDGQITVRWAFNHDLHRHATIRGVADACADRLRAIASTASAAAPVREVTAASFPGARLNDQQLASLLASLNRGATN